jgi:polyisoprenoid-binding protein YceI
MLLRTLAAFTAFALPLAPAVAQMPTKAPGAPIVSRVVAGTYAIEPSHTQVLFTVNHLGFSNYTGEFTNPSGSLTLDPRKPGSAKVAVSFPIKDVHTTAAALDAHLQKPEFFDAWPAPLVPPTLNRRALGYSPAVASEIRQSSPAVLKNCP